MLNSWKKGGHKDEKPWFAWPRGGVTRSIFMSRENKTINQAVTSMNAFSSLAVEEHQPTVSGELFMRPQ